MPAICLLFGITFIATYILGPAERAGFGSFALPGPAWLYLVAGLVLLSVALWLWRRAIWIALDALIGI